MLCRHLEEALQRVESSSGRKHDKFEGRVDKLLEELESVRACAVSPSHPPGPATICCLLQCSPVLHTSSCRNTVSSENPTLSQCKIQRCLNSRSKHFLINQSCFIQVDSSIQSDDIRYRVQQLELKLFGCGLDGSHSRESPGGRPRSSLGHRRGPAGLAVLDRLDSLERSVDSVSKVANKAKVPGFPCSSALACSLCTPADADVRRYDSVYAGDQYQP